jgi:hypothetical protein
MHLHCGTGDFIVRLYRRDDSFLCAASSVARFVGHWTTEETVELKCQECRAAVLLRHFLDIGGEYTLPGLYLLYDVRRIWPVLARRDVLMMILEKKRSVHRSGS